VSPIKDWFHNKDRYTKVSVNSEKRAVPDGVWSKCDACSEIVYQKELERNLRVCPKCNHHFQMSAQERLHALLDGPLQELDPELRSNDPLDFDAAKNYRQSLLSAQESTGLTEAVITGIGEIEAVRVVLAVMDFRFIGGSMGSVVGEKITRAVEIASRLSLPLVVVACSGGARMQEGILSLMQMAKTSAALKRFREAKQPYISVLTHPTTGGVTASFAALADVMLAEPNALIGFAGPRLIEQTIRQKLPKGFQTSEFLLEHGMIDMVVSRKDLRDTLAKLLEFLSPKEI
jgi:acetyl-CoA carboxylase carboxyl transferase subunit beta